MGSFFLNNNRRNKYKFNEWKQWMLRRYKWSFWKFLLEHFMNWDQEIICLKLLLVTQEYNWWLLLHQEQSTVLHSWGVCGYIPVFVSIIDSVGSNRGYSVAVSTVFVDDGDNEEWLALSVSDDRRRTRDTFIFT